MGQDFQSLLFLRKIRDRATLFVVSYPVWLTISQIAALISYQFSLLHSHLCFVTGLDRFHFTHRRAVVAFVRAIMSKKRTKVWAQAESKLRERQNECRNGYR